MQERKKEESRSRTTSQSSAQEHGQQDNRQNHRQHHQQATRLAPRIPLIPRRLPQLPIRAPRILVCTLHIVRNPSQLLALFSDNLRHLLEQHIQVAHTLLDILNLLLTLSNERILEVDVVLRREAQLLLLELLLAVATTALLDGTEGGAAFFFVGGSACCRDRGTLFLEGLALQGLKVGEGGLELAEELLLFVFLRGLVFCLS